MDDETDSTMDDDSLFDESDDGTDDTNDAEILSDENDSNTDGEAWLSDDEEQRLPEYYLVEASSLGVKQLRQRRYNPKT
jgi:hypothetical protein